MSKALTRLLSLIAEGWEFPDASSKASREHKVCENELTAQYDQHCIETMGCGVSSQASAQP